MSNSGRESKGDDVDKSQIDWDKIIKYLDADFFRIDDDGIFYDIMYLLNKHDSDYAPFFKGILKKALPEKFIGLFKEVLFRKSDKELIRLLIEGLKPNLDLFPPDQQELLAETLLNLGNFNVVIAMRNNGFQVKDKDYNQALKFQLALAELSDESKNEHKIKVYEENSEENKAIKKLIPMPLNERHLKLYKTFPTDDHQESFIKYHQQQVKFILIFMKSRGFTVDNAVLLLNLVAKQRARFANLYNSPHKFDFGAIRHEESETPFSAAESPYHPYKMLLADKQVRDNFVDGGLTTSMLLDKWRHFKPMSVSPDKIISGLAGNYLELYKAEFKNENEAKQAFAVFHWKAANFMPWVRGSAAIIDQLVDALWIHHFQSAPTKKSNVSLDCFALSLPLPKFTAQYPNFVPLSNLNELQSLIDELENLLEKKKKIKCSMMQVQSFLTKD